MCGAVYACCAAHTKGKNIQAPEFEALGNMFASVDWALPQCEEYKNDLVQPNLPGLTNVPQASSSTLMVQSAAPDPNSAATDAQWTKEHKMAPWLRSSL